ncbi:MAG: hypothetical protein JWP01_347 [Myxococcales bacterium]|nr:hypothetical protein [Myxococcales bacterium]
MKLLCAWLLVLTACTDLPSFDQTCGNFVIDPGEDCDEDPSSGTCDSQCRIMCDLDTRSCGGVAGYVCGVDGFCHAPSGMLSVHRPGEVPFPGKVFTVTDVDRDFLNDVVTVSDTSLTVNYGDPTGELLVQTSTLIPGARGEPAFTDLDSDGSMDVVIPTTDGLVAYSSPLDVVAPHPFVLDIGNPADCTPTFAGAPFNVFALDDETLGLLIARPDGKLGIATIRVDSQSTCPNLQQKVCDVRVGDFFIANESVSMAVYETSTAGQTGKLVAATSALVGGGTCVVNFTRPAGAPASVLYTVTEALATPMKARPALADFVGGGCPSLIDSTTPLAIKEHKGSGTPGACVLATATTTIPFGGAFPGPVVGSTPLSPPLSGAIQYGKDALVTERGVFAIPRIAGPARELYRADRTLTSVQAGDIDDDGDLDIVATSQGSDDIDVIQRSYQDSFLLLRLDTIGPVGAFVVGDFDGNESADIAYNELSATSQRLMIAFGTRDRPLDPIVAGTFRQIVELLPIQLKDSTDRMGWIDDLVVLDLPEGETNPVLTMLHGSPQRTMQSFFDPRIASLSGPSTAGDRFFAGVAGGQFFPSPPVSPGEPAPRYTDLLSMDYSIGEQPELWPVQGISYGVLEFSQNTQRPAIVNCALTPPAPGDRFCLETGRYVTWPRATDDVVIGIDSPLTGPRHLIVLDPLTFGSKTAGDKPTIQASYPTVTQLTSASVEGLSVRSLRVANVDADAEPELIVSLGDRAAIRPTVGAILVCDVDANGIPTGCTDLASQITELAGLGCVDAVPTAITPSGRGDAVAMTTTTDLVVSCRRVVQVFDPMPLPGRDPGLVDAPETELFRVSHDENGYRATSLRIVAGSLEMLEKGDVTGDGIEDILGIRIDGTTLPTLLVIPQCAASDEACKSPAFAVSEEAP